MRAIFRRFVLLLMLPLLVVACTTTQRGHVPPGGEQGEGDPAPGTMVMMVDNLPTLIFDGIARKVAKLTMVTTPIISYTSITAVTGLAQPAVGGSSPRTGVENDMAQFTAYMYAYNLPADNDFHVILGDTPTFQTGVTNLINVEVSGRPDKSDVTFLAVRNAFLAKVGNPVSLPRSTYQCLAVPIAVTVSGGPFWDTSHPHGNSGTSSCYGGVAMKTKNGWELHPVTTFQ